MFREKTLAWLVHLYTATGAIVGMIALLAAAKGHVRVAFQLLLVAAVIDGTDGLLARRARVSEVLPNFSGTYVDNAVDVLTYIFVPIFIIGWQELLPHPAWLAVPIIAALYGYGQVDMKTQDDFFLGFPSYWNVIALYMYWFQPPPLAAVLMVLVPAVLTFIPTRYLYPSRNSLYWKTTWSLAFIWIALVAFLLTRERPSRVLIWVTLYGPAYYFIVSFYTDWKIRRGAV